MRITFIAVCLILATGHAVAAPPPSPPPSLPWARTRPLSASALALIETAAERSAIVQGLLDDLERTDLVVYIADAMPGAFVGPKSAMTLVSGVTATRYVMIRIDSMRLPLKARIAALGHELYHALEVAAAPEVKDSAGLAALYRRIGWEGRQDRFETQEAREVSRRVRSELMHPAKMALGQSEAIADAEARARAERGGPTSR